MNKIINEGNEIQTKIYDRDNIEDQQKLKFLLKNKEDL